MTYNIATFMEWFWTQFISLLTGIYNILDNIAITNNISLFEFILIVFLIGIVARIIITAPGSKEIVKASEKRGK